MLAIWRVRIPQSTRNRVSRSYKLDRLVTSSRIGRQLLQRRANCLTSSRTMPPARTSRILLSKQSSHAELSYGWWLLSAPISAIIAIVYYWPWWDGRAPARAASESAYSDACGSRMWWNGTQASVRSFIGHRPVSIGLHFACIHLAAVHCAAGSTTDLYKYSPDAVPPIHAVSYHVATDKPPRPRWRQVPVYFSDNQQPIATRGKKHVARYWSINIAATAVSLIAHISPLAITTKLAAAIFGGGLFGGGVLPAQYCPCGFNACISFTCSDGLRGPVSLAALIEVAPIGDGLRCY